MTTTIEIADHLRLSMKARRCLGRMNSDIRTSLRMATPLRWPGRQDCGGGFGRLADADRTGGRFGEVLAIPKSATGSACAGIGIIEFACHCEARSDEAIPA